MSTPTTCRHAARWFFRANGFGWDCKLLLANSVTRVGSIDVIYAANLRFSFRTVSKIGLALFIHGRNPKAPNDRAAVRNVVQAFWRRVLPRKRRGGAAGGHCHRVAVAGHRGAGLRVAAANIQHTGATPGGVGGLV